MAANKLIPADIRESFKTHAYWVYDYVCADLPEAENYETEQQVEIIRDANRIKTCVQSHSKVDVELLEFLKVHEYDPEYQADMDKAVKEAIGG